MSKTIVPLNRYMVELVEPKPKCIRNRHNYNKSSDLCNVCFLCNGDNCVYETIDVEVAHGSYETNYDKPRTNYFEQFCCPKCGELIKKNSTYTITWDDIKCPHCETEYVCLHRNYKPDLIFKLARKCASDQ